jgi:hypothetical protein
MRLLPFAILFILSLGAFAQVDPDRLIYYRACHKELDELSRKIPEQFEDPRCDKAMIEGAGNLQSILSDLKLEDYFRYVAREKKDKNSEVIKFLKDCTKKRSAFHLLVGGLALEAYDISFLDKENPSLENKRDGRAPEGYELKKYYGSQPEACFKTGFKGALFQSTSSDHVVFSITGTEGSPIYSSGKEREKYPSEGSSLVGGLLGFRKKKGLEISAKDKDKEDWAPITGQKQFKSSCAQQMIKDAVELAKKSGKKIVFTGHSLGGALAQALSYRVQEQLEKELPNHTPVEAVTFMAAGGQALVRPIKHQTLSKLRSTSYTSLGDIVSGFGTHIGEMREMVRTPEYESKFETRELPVLETHTLDLPSFKPLEESLQIFSQDRAQRNSEYMRRINFKDNQPKD